ncbi:UNVERIFIED_CONTAM: hypothetical protein NCL1_17940 [Trichonephila clavipes]
MTSKHKNIAYRLNQNECAQWLQSAFYDEFSYRATEFRWFKEFWRDQSFLQDKKHTGSPRPAVIPDNVSAIRKLLIEDSRCTHQVILSIRSAAIYKIIHEELHIKK